VQLAVGQADAAWSPDVRPWDVAAVLLVEEAGGAVGDLVGLTSGSWPSSLDVLAASRAVWEPLRALLAEVYGD
jgi:myo-inositol-1(or 4)-monophosphatase